MTAMTATCRAYVGRVALVRGRRQLVDNRCDACPLRTPCLKWGSAPARTFEELHAARDVFTRDAEALL